MHSNDRKRHSFLALLFAASLLPPRRDPGWTQTVVTGAYRNAVRVKTVTLLNAGCVFDWVLVTPNDASFDAAEPVFDAWWPTFRRPSEGGDDGGEAPEAGEPAP